MSWRCKLFYIGQTKRKLAQRTVEHLRANLQDKDARASALRAHEWIHSFGAHMYVALPLAFVPCGETRAAERRLIRLLQPQLNVSIAHAVRAGRTAGFRMRAGRRRNRPWIHIRRKAGGPTQSQYERASADVDCGLTGPSTATALNSGITTGDLVKLFSTWVPRFGYGHSGRDTLYVNDVVDWRPGAWTYTDFDILRLCYGDSLILLPNRDDPVCLADIISKLKSGNHLQFVVTWATLTPSSLALYKRKLVTLLRQPFTIAALYRNSLSDMIGLLRAARLFSKKPTRTKLKGVLFDLVKRRYGLNLRPRPVLRVPYHETIPRSDLTAIVDRALADMPTSMAVRAFIRRRVRVVYTQRQSVEKLMHNFRKFVRDFPTARPPCDCHHARELPKLNGHVHCRASDLLDTHFHLLAQNCKNVPRPDAPDTATELSKAERDLRNALFDMGASPDFDVLLADARAARAHVHTGLSITTITLPGGKRFTIANNSLDAIRATRYGELASLARMPRVAAQHSSTVLWQPAPYVRRCSKRTGQYQLT